jgi:hypothetical protein
MGELVGTAVQWAFPALFAVLIVLAATRRVLPGKPCSWPSW